MSIQQGEISHRTIFYSFTTHACRMDPYEVTKATYARVRALDPENVSKIVGYLLLQDHAEQDMLNLALGSESLLLSVVTKAKEDLGLLNSNAPSAPWQVHRNFPHPPPSEIQAAEVQPDAHPFHPPFHKYQFEHERLGNGPMPPASQYHHQPLEQQPQFGRAFPNEHFYPETFSFLDRSRPNQDDSTNFPSEHGSHSSNSSNGGWKPCVYFSRGFCKHGSACKFLHYQQDHGDEEHVMMPPLLDKLDMELEELLRARKSTIPVSSLPQLYYERFGRPLQLERRYGHRSLALAEDAGRCQAGENGANSPSSRQIYLTFPAESTFSEDDVSAHFSAYGPVQDVRIPYQQKRMFGFVTFLHSETVRVILSESAPHYVCGARVLVKPYREKGKHCTKKGFDHPRQLHGEPIASRFFEDSQQRQENSLDLERKLAELHIAGIQQRYAEAQAAAFMGSSNDYFSFGHRHEAFQNNNLGYTVQEELGDRLNLHGSSNSTGNFPDSPSSAYDLKQENGLKDSS